MTTSMEYGGDHTTAFSPSAHDAPATDPAAPGRLRRQARTQPYVRAVERVVGGFGSVLDVGCGSNSPIGRFATRPDYSVGVDLYEPWLAESSSKGIHDHYERMNVLDIAEHFGPGSFDVVVACDLLEHLEHEDGSLLFAQMEHVARRRVVILTPNGYVAQEATWGNPLQVHRSGWTVHELRARGYAVSGLNGLRLLRGERGLIRWKPGFIWGRVSAATQPLARCAPTLAFHILCVKDIG